MRGKEHPLEKQFAAEIESVAQYLAKDIRPPDLRKQGDHEGAQSLGFAIDLLNENSLMGAVKERTLEIKRLDEMRELHSQPVPRRKPTKKPWQSQLSSAHPEGYKGFMRLSDEDLGEPKVFDPEQNVMDMHNKTKRRKILDRDVKDWWRAQLKEWGYTQANRTMKLQITSREQIHRLKEAGVWYIVEKPVSDITEQEMMYIHAAMHSPRPFDEV